MIKASKNYIESRTEWMLEDVQILGEETWVARATTTHLSKQGEAEHVFGVLVNGYNHVTFNLDAVPAMLVWCQSQKERKS